jgi:hypothetical protein
MICPGNLQLALWSIQENHEELQLKLRENYHESEMEKRITQANALHYLASRCIIKDIFKIVIDYIFKHNFS